MIDYSCNCVQCWILPRRDGTVKLVYSNTRGVNCTVCWSYGDIWAINMYLYIFLFTLILPLCRRVGSPYSTIFPAHQQMWILYSCNRTHNWWCCWFLWVLALVDVGTQNTMILLADSSPHIDRLICLKK